jgi:hypothetical protein
MSNFKITLSNTLDYLIPTDVEMIRLGNNTDGGYVIPKIALEKSDALLSFGLGENWTFDEDWHKLKPTDQIHLYDGEKTKMTFPKPENVWNRFEPIDLIKAYEDFWVGNRRHWVENVGTQRGWTTFYQAMARLNSANVFLKMDIEGGEYPMLPEMLGNAKYITGIAAELHAVNGNRAAFENFVRAMLTEYEVVHVHANVTLPFGPEGLTEGLEVVFLRKDLCNSTKKRYNTYHALDFSNFINFPDFEYSFEEPTAKKKK